MEKKKKKDLPDIESLLFWKELSYILDIIQMCSNLSSTQKSTVIHIVVLLRVIRCVLFLLSCVCFALVFRSSTAACLGIFILLGFF